MTRRSTPVCMPRTCRRSRRRAASIASPGCCTRRSSGVRATPCTTRALARPSNILLACEGEQRERYLLPAVRGERIECLAMTEPQAGSDLRGMKTSAVEKGGDFVINGTKHFISHADHADFVILFAATRRGGDGARQAQAITAFLDRQGNPGFEVLPGYRNVSHRGYNNSILQFNDCRVPKSAVLGEVHRGFEVANTWLGATRLQVAANCLGRAERALELCQAVGGRPRAVRSADRQVPGGGVQARRHGGRAARRGATDAGGRLEARHRKSPPTWTWRSPS